MLRVVKQGCGLSFFEWRENSEVGTCSGEKKWNDMADGMEGFGFYSYWRSNRKL